MRSSASRDIIGREPLPPTFRHTMHDASLHSISPLLQELRAGNQSAFDELLPLVYDELHRLAERQRRRWDGDDTLDTTALIHEAYLRLAGQSAPEWQNRAHFLAVAATAMRQVLIDYARRKSTAKRGGQRVRLPLEEVDALLQGAPSSDGCDELLVALDESLRRLNDSSERQRRIVECRFIGAMSVEETAEALGISPATVKRGWAMAQAWLYRDLKQVAGHADGS
jgi:RNA polymerase sigma factor (TIGR02999 family)